MIGGMRRCGEFFYGIWGNRLAGVSETAVYYGEPLGTNIRNDGIPAVPGGCEACNCFSGNHVRNFLAEPIVSASGRNYLNDISPGSGFVKVAETVLRAPDEYPANLRRWFYFGPVASMIRAWKPMSVCAYFDPNYGMNRRFQEPRDRSGYAHIDDGKKLNLSSPFLLSYTTINGDVPLYDQLNGGGLLESDESRITGYYHGNTLEERSGTAGDVYQYQKHAVPVASGGTITISYWLNRSLADWSPFWHPVLDLDTKSNTFEVIGQEVGYWEEVDFEHHEITTRGGEEGEFSSQPIYVRTVAKETSDIQGPFFGPRVGAGRVVIEQMGIADGSGSSVIAIGPAGSGILETRTCRGDTGTSASVFGLQVPGFWRGTVSLSGDHIMPVMARVDGQVVPMNNKLSNSHPCVYPIRVSQRGYGLSDWPANPLP